MTSRDFVFWLQGYFEVTDANRGERSLGGWGLSDNQALKIRSHLAMVFKHEIDPSFGDAQHQKELTMVHEAQKDKFKALETLVERVDPGAKYNC